MIVKIINHGNTPKNFFPFFCQITTTAYLKIVLHTVSTVAIEYVVLYAKYPVYDIG